MSAEFDLRLAPADEERLAAVAAHARREEWARRLLDRDTSLWTDDPAAAAAVAQRLGWLDAPAHFTDQIAALEGFGDGIRGAGFRAAGVMGMGGSSPGTPTEPLAFLADAWARVEAALEASGSDQRPGDFFVAITDPGRSVTGIPHHDELREIFLNPPDIGGRYSAVSYVGLVPASLIGLDLDALLTSATTMLAACREPDPERNPGLLLGVALGELARAGRDKLTFLADPTLASFGAWAEQLIAESTGKHGVGIVPVDREPLGDAGSYGADRAFVRLSLAGAPDPSSGLLDALAAAGHPVIRLVIEELGEVALGEAVAASLGARKAGRYVGLQAFIAPSPERDAAFDRLRALIRDRTGYATTAGYGPRFLHSTGQLHKGGAPIGWFLQLTEEHPDDREIPGWPYSFGRLIDAQAQGDAESIAAHGLPILRLRLGRDAAADLAALERAFAQALGG